ncbi:MAG TPA: dihydropteroate synthase [Bryobacteraceae bacterium]|jgi:dihydropteroate synthase|nr:dihydropteroate synthase [Bryobacteraceae bacterium]
MNRKIYYWKLRDSEMQLGERTLLMGVLNVTPDSFSDGGRFNDPDRAYARALELEEQGADIIDIGAESTRPGSRRITADEEWQRLVPILKRLRGNLRVPLSLDTYKSEIAERAIQYGVEIINDPSGLTFDAALAKAAANGNAGLILNHMRGQPETWPKLPPMPDPAATVARELDATANRARHAGVERARIVIDPGLGFGKRKEQNAEILAHLSALAKLDFPILAGPSRKSFLAQASESETVYATAAAVTAAILNGAHIVRVHDVKEMRVVAQVADEIARAAQVAPVAAGSAVRERTRTGPDFQARPRPTRPPLVQPRIAEPANPAVPAKPALEEIAKPMVEPAAEIAAKTRPTFQRKDGSLPPRKPFKPKTFERRPSEERSGPPARGRDFRFDRDRPPRREERGSKPGGFQKPGFKGGFKPGGPGRSLESGVRPGRDRPEGSPPRSGPARSGPPRSAPPRSGPPRSGPPRSGPPRSGPPRSGPPKGSRPDAGPGRPPKRPFRKRP